MEDTPGEKAIERCVDWTAEVNWDLFPVVIPIIIIGFFLFIMILFERSRYSFTGMEVTIDTD